MLSEKVWQYIIEGTEWMERHGKTGSGLYLDTLEKAKRYYNL